MVNAGNMLDGWEVEYHSGIPVYRQIINQVCAAVAAESFKAGDQIPTIRALSERLKVNPNTVAKAYRELELKGIITSERGSGSFISQNGNGSLLQAQPPTLPSAAVSVAMSAPAAASDTVAKRSRLATLYERLLVDMAGSGLTERELLSYIKENNP